MARRSFASPSEPAQPHPTNGQSPSLPLIQRARPSACVLSDGPISAQLRCRGTDEREDRRPGPISSAGCRHCRARRQRSSPNAADEPGVTIILRRARLAGDHMASDRAARPVPRVTTAVSMRAIIAATSGSIAGCGGARAVSTAAPPGAQRLDGERAHAPPAIEERGIGGRNFQQPNLPGAKCSDASFGQLVGDAEPRRDLPHHARPPACSSRRTADVLIDCASASSTEISPRIASFEISGAPVADPDRGIQHVSSGRTPFSSAASQTNGLNADPG